MQVSRGGDQIRLHQLRKVGIHQISEGGKEKEAELFQSTHAEETTVNTPHSGKCKQITGRIQNAEQDAAEKT